ncbi:MAG: hypothetical protein Q9Q40_04475 [Acidobacteriota bacterium]|nr:hypothetical protein [Acidobacteriota bacterium]MDQ7088119.1 hypothetical protein [Acidobacteriota bacterium]
MRRLLLPVLVCALLGNCAGSRPPAGPWVMAPLDAQGRPLAPSSVVRFDRPGLHVEVQALSASERAAWIRRRFPDTGDPLAGRRDRRRWLTLRLTIAATGDLPVHLETQSLRLWPDKGRVSTAPLDYTRAFEWLRPDRESGPAASEVRRFMQGLLDGPVDLAPGSRREGLLIFPEPSPEARRLLLELPFVQVGSTTHRIRIPFDKVPVAAPAAAGEQP